MAFKLSKFMAGAGGAASQIADANIQNRNAQGLAQIKAQILADKQARLQSLGSAKQQELEYLSEQIVGTKNPATGKPYTIEEARQDVALRASGITARAGTITADERIANDTGLTNKVAGSKGSIEQSKSYGKEVGKTEGLDDSNRAGTEANIAAGKQSGKDQESRRTLRIDLGLDAAKGLPTVKRAVALLDRVETGGPQSISLALRRKLGVEGADEGELSNKLAKAVLSQLKATFGAQFTQQEGERLERIEAGFGKSTESNRRLLNELYQVGNEYAEQAMNDAAAIGDYDTASAIKKYMSFEFDEDADILSGDFSSNNRSNTAPVSTPQANAKGWKLMTDANGNKAYVSPDGTQFEEVQ